MYPPQWESFTLQWPVDVDVPSTVGILHVTVAVYGDAGSVICTERLNPMKTKVLAMKKTDNCTFFLSFFKCCTFTMKTPPLR